ncbi:GNAT family N-acetyltransferase [Streptomyces sp. Tue6028]|uniref:GNAT family N-acetyltransferase n=1 Tax=Streptomyces sp. Tue6028 TaxID=2036037 RepID=UPI000D1C0BAC|nr:N-acetyltransferase [Streptomyces sp. Tue6028]
MPALPWEPLPSPPPSRRLRIRPASEADLSALHDLDAELFPDFTYPYFVLRQFFDVYAEDLLLLDDGSSLCGYVLSATTPDGRRSWVLGLGVTKDLRGQGQGRRLMREALHELRNRDVREVWLSVEPANDAAIALYGSLGFVHQGSRKDYFGPDEHRLLMMLRL